MMDYVHEAENTIEGVGDGINSRRISRSEFVQVDHNGMKASDYLKPEQIGDAPDGRTTVIEAVRDDREESGAKSPKIKNGTPVTALGQPFAVFRHSSEFTEEEDVVILNGLLAHLPVYIIAAKVHCSRGILAKHIKESKLLQAAWEDREESMLDHVEFQAKRLVDSGNPAMIMYWLDHKGRGRGWGEQDNTEVTEDESRIVIGEISDAEVAEAERQIAENGRQLGVSVTPEGETVVGTVGVGERSVKVKGPSDIPSPMEYALESERLQKEQDERDLAQYGRTADGRTSAEESDDDGGGYSEPAPWDDGGDDFGGGFGF